MLCQSLQYSKVTQLYIYLHSYNFFFVVVFLGLHLWYMEVPRLGVQSELQQLGIRAASATYTTAHGNTGSLTH